MKKFISVLFAIAITAFLSAFKIITPQNRANVQFLDDMYAVFEGPGEQRDHTKYTILPYIPEPCPGSNTLCWFRIRDCDNDNDIDSDDFYCSFDEIDSDGDGSLDDQIEDHVRLEKKS